MRYFVVRFEISATYVEGNNTSEPFWQQVELHLHQMLQDQACATLQFLAADDECTVGKSS